MRLPKGKPQITDEEVDKIVNHFFPEPPPVLIVGIRGYYSKTFAPAGNNQDVWDDAFLVYENGTLVESFNGNTDPTQYRKDDAMLREGIYTFYKGVHNRRVKGLRAYPEGVGLPCKRQDRNGNWYHSVCHYINFHDPVGRTTGSEGCQTLPQPQFNEFRDLVYKLMTAHKLKVVTFLLTSEPKMKEILAK